MWKVLPTALALAVTMTVVANSQQKAKEELERLRAAIAGNQPGSEAAPKPSAGR